MAAALLLEQGYQVTGLFMTIYGEELKLEENARHACYGPGEEEDMEAAAQVCQKLSIPFCAVDLRKEFSQHVLTYFRSEYLAGRTPNPCVICNQRLKFDFLSQRAGQAGFKTDYFATGHYARIERDEERYYLAKARDNSKDQSYFLYALTQEQLARIIFPLGDYTKVEVREVARKFGLHTAELPESQDFIAGGDYSPLFTPDQVRPGEIVDQDGKVLGKHRGIIHYTVGQRKGLGIQSPWPLYVERIDAQKNQIVVAKKESIFSRGLIAAHISQTTAENIGSGREVTAKIRIKSPGAAAQAKILDGERLDVIFKEPQLAVTPGQSVVLYSAHRVLGGGIIENSLDGG